MPDHVDSKLVTVIVRVVVRHDHHLFNLSWFNILQKKKPGSNQFLWIYKGEE